MLQPNLAVVYIDTTLFPNIFNIFYLLHYNSLKKYPNEQGGCQTDLVSCRPEVDRG